MFTVIRKIYQAAEDDFDDFDYEDDVDENSEDAAESDVRDLDDEDDDDERLIENGIRNDLKMDRARDDKMAERVSYPFRVPFHFRRRRRRWIVKAAGAGHSLHRVSQDSKKGGQNVVSE